MASSILLLLKTLFGRRTQLQIKSKILVVDFHSTVENICKYFLEEIKKHDLPKNISSVSVKIYETNEEYAEEKIVLS